MEKLKETNREREREEGEREREKERERERIKRIYNNKSIYIYPIKFSLSIYPQYIYTN